MAVLQCIRGLPGSGKTTLAKALVSSGLFSCYYEADMWMVEHGIYKFQPEKLRYCHASCQLAVEEALIAGKSVIVSNTSCSLREVNIYRDMAKLRNADFQVVELKSPWKSVHNVPAAKLAEMNTRWEKVA